MIISQLGSMLWKSKSS